MSINVDSKLQPHPWGLEYLALKAVVTIIRTVAGPPKSNAAPEVPSDISLETLETPSRDQGRSIKIRVYTPTGSQDDRSKRLPVHVNWHGSGFVIPQLDSDKDFCVELVQKVKCAVVDADVSDSSLNGLNSLS